MVDQSFCDVQLLNVTLEGMTKVLGSQIDEEEFMLRSCTISHLCPTTGPTYLS